MSEYVQPKFRYDVFNCPNCNVYAQQNWCSLTEIVFTRMGKTENFDICKCIYCTKISIWKDKEIIFPSTGGAPLPNPDMPDDIKKDYLEARDIVTHSPRSACALLRLCVEKICNEQVSSGNDLNEKIKKLGKQGLDTKIIKALDVVRVIGSQAIHPLKMNLKDDKETAVSLFEIVNYISNWAHTDKKRIDRIHASLPENQINAIIKRDHDDKVQN